jgi:hypothetical protein
MKFALVVGHIMSATILTVFYYTVFAFFAIPFKLFGKTIYKKKGWVIRNKKFTGEDVFKKEYST